MVRHVLMPIIPAIWEAEAGESLEPVSQDHAMALQPRQKRETPSPKQTF